MKKLMVMLTAAATAIGLYAADPIDSTSFETDGDFAEGVLVKGDKWSCEDTEAKLLRGVYNTETDPAYAYNETDNVRYSAFDAQANYLSVKTTFGKPLVRAIGATTVGDDALFFDQLVKFTATDEDPKTDYESYDDAKIIVYAQNMTPDEQTEVNHLMVKAGRYAGGELTADTYDLGAIDLTAWHRLTIKANKVSGNLIGFQIFVDGVAKAFTDKDPAFDATAAAGFAASLKSLNTYKKLFPSLVNGTTLNDVCFDGQGSIDDLIATTEPAGKWAEDATITLNWDATQLTALTYAYGEVPATAVDDLSSGTQVIPYVDGSTVITLAPTYATGFGNGVITGDEKILVNGLTFTASADGAVATFTAEDVTPRIQIGEDTYPSFSKAIAAIGDLGADEVKTLKLNLPVEVDYNETDLVTEAFLQAGAGEIVIDLNGQTITGPGVADNFVILAEGKVTITDSSEGKLGKIVAGEVVDGGAEGAVKIQSADNATAGFLTINAGTFDGAVVCDEGVDGEYAAAEASIVAGSFLKSANGDTEFTLKDSVVATSKLDDADETYFIVTELQQWTVTFKADADAEAFKTVQVVDGETVEAPEDAPTKDYYTFDSWDFDFETPINGDTTIYAKWNAKQYTITYNDKNGDPIDGIADQYTKFTYETKSMALYTPASPDEEGYDFGGWTDETMNPFDGSDFSKLDWEAVDEADGITLDADFSAAHEYTITYMNGENELTGLTPAIYTVIAAKKLPETVDVLGVAFKGWYDNAQFEGEAVTEIAEGEMGDKIFYAKVKAIVDPAQDVIDEDVEGYNDLEPEAQAAAKANTSKLVELCGDKDKTKAWIASAYGESAKLPAAKLAVATEDDIAIAVEYNVPVMTEGTAVVEAADADGFVFTLKDGDETVILQQAAKIAQMISWTDDLSANEFAVNTDQVGTELSEGKIKAVFKKPDGEAAGFMKLIMKAPGK